MPKRHPKPPFRVFLASIHGSSIGAGVSNMIIPPILDSFCACPPITQCFYLNSDLESSTLLQGIRDHLQHILPGGGLPDRPGPGWHGHHHSRERAHHDLLHLHRTHPSLRLHRGQPRADSVLCRNGFHITTGAIQNQKII